MHRVGIGRGMEVEFSKMEGMDHIWQDERQEGTRTGGKLEVLVIPESMDTVEEEAEGWR